MHNQLTENDIKRMKEEIEYRKLVVRKAVSYTHLDLLVKSGLVASRSEGRRAVEQGGVSMDGEKVTDIKAVFAGEDFHGEGKVLKRGKKNFKRIVVK